jgi:hypothetical protein
MEDGPRKALTLYRGYVIYFNRGDELVTPVLAPGGGTCWQSEEKLVEALTKQVELGREKNPADTVCAKDIGGYIERFEVSLSS